MEKEIERKDWTMKKIVEFVNNSNGEFIIHVEFEEREKEWKDKNRHLS